MSELDAENLVAEDTVIAGELDVTETPEVTEGEPEVKPEKERIPQPAFNMIKRQQKELRQLRAEMRRLTDTFGQQKEAAGKGQSPEEPKETDFDNYGDYLRARQDYLMEQHKAGLKAETQESRFTEQQQAIRARHDAAVEAQVSELVTSYPEVKQVMAANLQVIEAMPEAVENLMYELDDPVAAGYALAKEGRLASIYTLSPTMAAAELIMAQQRGQQYLSALQGGTKPVAQAPGAVGQPVVASKTPQPLPRATGAGAGRASLQTMSTRELLDWGES